MIEARTPPELPSLSDSERGGGSCAASCSVLRVRDLPSTLSLLGNDIQIVESSDPSFWGQWDPVARVIQLDAELTDCRLLEILIHESLHALYSWTGLEGRHGEERTVSKLAIGVVSLLGENPWLAKLLSDFSIARNLPRQMELLAWASFGKGLCCKPNE